MVIKNDKVRDNDLVIGKLEALVAFVMWAITKKDILDVFKFHFMCIKKHVFTGSKRTQKP